MAIAVTKIHGLDAEGLDRVQREAQATGRLGRSSTPSTAGETRSSQSFPGDPDPEWLVREETLTALAKRVGMDPGRLESTVERWNGFVVEGRSGSR